MSGPNLTLAGLALAFGFVASASASSDLSIAIEDSADPAKNSSQVAYVFTVDNAGPHPVVGKFEVTAQISAPATFTGLDDTWSCQTSGGPVVCTRIGLAVGATASLKLLAAMPGKEGPVAVVAHVRNVSDPDPNPANDDASESTEVYVNKAPIVGDQTFVLSEDVWFGGMPEKFASIYAVDDGHEAPLTFEAIDIPEIFAVDPVTGDLSLLGAVDFEQDDSYGFDVAVSDGELTTQSHITIQIGDVQEKPTATDNRYVIPIDSTLAVAAPGALGDDTDPEGDGLFFFTAGGPSHGSMTSHATGLFQYWPDSGFAGEDTVTYFASDGQLQSDPATITIIVTHVGGPGSPTGNADDYETTRNQKLVVGSQLGVLANDTDPNPRDHLFAHLAFGPTHGLLALSEDGGFTYTPAPDFAGIDSFSYRVYDGMSLSTPAVVTLNVIDSAANDSDGDGVPDGSDPCPFDAQNGCIPPPDCSEQGGDTDGDNICNGTDPDDDNDGLPDGTDPCPLDAQNGCVPPPNCAEQGGDSDGDNICNGTDPDDDNDGLPDGNDPCPLDAQNECIPPPDCSAQGGDTDGDNICNGTDPDDDNDGLPDGNDPCPLDAQNGCDEPGEADSDGDGFLDTEDNCPSIANPDQADADADDIGDACDNSNTSIESDLSITKSNGMTGVVAGAETVYVLDVRNEGLDAVTASIADALPINLVDGAWTCHYVPGALGQTECPAANGNGSVAIDVPMLPGDHVRVEVIARVVGEQGTFVSNTATVATGSGQADVDLANNSSTDEDPIAPDALFHNGFED